MKNSPRIFGRDSLWILIKESPDIPHFSSWSGASQFSRKDMYYFSKWIFESSLCLRIPTYIFFRIAILNFQNNISMNITRRDYLWILRKVIRIELHYEPSEEEEGFLYESTKGFLYESPDGILYESPIVILWEFPKMFLNELSARTSTNRSTIFVFLKDWTRTKWDTRKCSPKIILNRILHKFSGIKWLYISYVLAFIY